MRFVCDATANETRLWQGMRLNLSGRGIGWGVQGMQALPQKFWFDENPGKILGNFCKICENLCKILGNWPKAVKTYAKSLKIWANFLKIRANIVPNVLWYEKMAPDVLWFEKNGAQNHMKTFLEVIRKMVFMRKYSHKKWPRNILGKFGDIRAKILRTQKNLPAPTFLLSRVASLAFRGKNCNFCPF